MTKLSPKKLYVWIGMVAVLVAGGVLLSKLGNNIEISNKNGVENVKKEKSTLVGIECENYYARPYAVMLSSDKEARPLSGIGRRIWYLKCRW